MFYGGKQKLEVPIIRVSLRLVKANTFVSKDSAPLRVSKALYLHR